MRPGAVLPTVSVTTKSNPVTVLLDREPTATTVAGSILASSG